MHRHSAGGGHKIRPPIGAQFADFNAHQAGGGVGFGNFANFDEVFDALKLFEEESGYTHLYTRSNDGIELTINTMPETKSIPLYFQCNESGVYSITATELNFDNYQNVYLVDQQNGVEQ